MQWVVCSTRKDGGTGGKSTREPDFREEVRGHGKGNEVWDVSVTEVVLRKGRTDPADQGRGDRKALWVTLV